jgi:DNA excision repair protein ERCC-2
VIRTEQDQGVVFLIDDRYRRAAVRALLPGWWALDRAPPHQPGG